MLMSSCTARWLAGVTVGALTLVSHRFNGIDHIEVGMHAHSAVAIDAGSVYDTNTDYIKCNYLGNPTNYAIKEFLYRIQQS